MVVNFTSNINLAKPTEAELSLNWARSIELQEDNNLIVIDETDIVLTAYTPVMGAQTTPPSVGAGVLRGEYQDIQGFVCGCFTVEFLDPGITAGSGEYGVRLPFVVDGAYHTVGTAFNQAPGINSIIGEGYIYDNSTVNTSGTIALDAITVGGVSYARLVTETYVGKSSRVFTSATPFVVATLDRFSGNFFYKRV